MTWRKVWLMWVLFAGAFGCVEEPTEVGSSGWVLDEIPAAQDMSTERDVRGAERCPLEGVHEGDVWLDRRGAELLECDHLLKGDLIVPSGARVIPEIPALRRVTGAVILKETELEGLEGLQGLREIGGLELKRNSQLVSLSGLEQVSVRDQGDLLVFGNESLQTLSGLGGLASVKNLEIAGNTALEDLRGLETLQEVRKFARIENNVSLQDISGLSALERVGGALLEVSGPAGSRSAYSLHIRSNPRLRTLEVPRLTHVHGDLVLGQLELLTSLKGLLRLEHVGGVLRLTGAPVLEDLTGLERLERLGGGLELRELGISTLADLSGLVLIGGLTGGGGHLVLEDLPSLTTLAGLERVRFMGFGRLDVTDVPLLEGLDGLDFEHANLTNVSIVRAPALTDLGSLGMMPEPGVLRFQGTGLVTLEGLAGVTRLGQLYLQENPSLMSFGGLEQLVRLERLEVRNNSALTTLEGLYRLELVGSERSPMTGHIFVLDDNAGLQGWRLDALRAVYGGMQVTGHPRLRTCLIYETHRRLETREQTALEAPPNDDPCPMNTGG